MTKNKRVFIEITLVFLFLVFPPLFVSPADPPFQGQLLALPPVLFVITVLLLAFSEELLYRAYLPWRLKVLLPERKWLTESIPLLFFALGHRYLGWQSVVFALAAGSLFRLLFIFVSKKKGPVAALAVNGTVHGLWNLALYQFISA